MKKKINGIVFSLMILGLSICGSISAEVIDRIVAIVDNDIITLVQLNKESAPYMKNIESAGYSDEKKKEMIQDIHKKLLTALIDRSLTRQEAMKYHIEVSDIEINTAVESVKRDKVLSQAEFERALEQEGLTLTEYRDNIKNQILQTRLINHAVKSKVIITESDIKKQYDANADKYAGKKKYHLRNILMDNESEINAIRKKLDNHMDFATLAKETSMAPNASDGGDLGVFDITNFSETIKASISQLKKGEYTNVISTAQGFQIFYIQDIVLENGKTYAQAHDEIQNSLYQEQVAEKFKTWLESLKKKAHIEIKL
ncbi:SurA N-terminal domain-containing protein [Desulfobacula sp.]|uniref:SurA N-terminal domain-containing protein n=1 Tax=Desulfobacula sp. TaxID=2593537 RepID=UPI00262E37B3|nr:SurA N-terminal domain-containing protein [Desulfobacula sp.]